MTRTVRWTVKALDEVDEIIGYIAKRDEAAAAVVRRRVEEAADRLARHPTGRPSRVDGYFEKPVPKTRLTLCYKATHDSLLIVRCIHQSRNWPKEAWPSSTTPSGR